MAGGQNKETENSRKSSGRTTKNTSASRSRAASSNKGRTSAGKNNTSQRKTGKSQTVNRKVTEEEKAHQNDIRDEITVIVVLAASILMVLSTFNMCGKLGEWISYGLFGLFGRLAYLFPLLVFFGISFFVSNKKNRTAKIKLAAAISCYLFLVVFFHMLTEPYVAGGKLWTSFTESASGKRGGGLIGGIGVKLLYPLLGNIGSYVLLIVLILVCLILVTQRRIVIPFFKKSRTVYDKAAKQHRERAIEREKEKELAADAREKYAKGELDFNLTNAEAEDKKLPDKAAGLKEAAAHKTDEQDIVIPEIDSADIAEAAKRFEDIVSTGQKAAEPVNVDAVYGETLFPKEDFDFTVSHMKEIAPTDLKEILPDEIVKEDILEDSYPSNSVVFGSIGKKEAEVIEDTEESVSAVPNGDSGPEKPVKKAESPSAAENARTAADIENALVEKKEYVFPSMDLLIRGKANASANSDEHLRQTAMKLKQTLESFGVKVQISNVSCGPSVTRYELQPEQGVKVSKIVSLSDDIKLNLAVADIRIEAPIPGKAAIGIEVPNKENTTVMLRDLLESRDFKDKLGGIAFAAGRDISGQVIVADIAKMPHLLVAGATGSGKSVCINTLIMSIIYKYKPEDVRLIMIDPKVVELSVYNGIPHLLIPVVTDPKKAAGALNWAVMEMEDRYKKFAELNVRDLKGYNEKVSKAELESEDYPVLPQIVIIIDELADLMMVAPGEVEDAICRLAQLARACGIHLVIATQRPSVNVITGLIKANIPSRIAFSVSSGVDSRTIIDMNGAEKLLGKGDMLFYPSGYQKPVRVQGAFVSDKEVNDVVEFIKEQSEGAGYSEDIAAKIKSSDSAPAGGGEKDDYFAEAGKFIIDKDKASIGMLQRMFRIGFNRAARIMDQLCDAGVVGPEEGTKPRKVLMSMEQFEQYIDEYL